VLVRQNTRSRERQQGKERKKKGDFCWGSISCMAPMGAGLVAAPGAGSALPAHGSAWNA